MKSKIITLGIALLITISAMSISAQARPRYRSVVYVTRTYPVIYRQRYYRPVYYRPYYRPRSSFSFVISSGPAYPAYYVRHRRYCGYRGYYARY